MSRYIVKARDDSQWGECWIEYAHNAAQAVENIRKAICQPLADLIAEKESE